MRTGQTAPFSDGYKRLMIAAAIKRQPKTAARLIDEVGPDFDERWPEPATVSVWLRRAGVLTKTMSIRRHGWPPDWRSSILDDIARGCAVKTAIDNCRASNGIAPTQTTVRIWIAERQGNERP